MTDNNSTDLLEIDTNVQPLDWGSTSTQVDSENNNTLEKSNNTNSEEELLSVDPDVPALDWTTYNPEALKYLDQEPREDKWYDNFGVPVLSGMYGQARNEINAVMNPVDQLLDALTGGKVDIDSISTGGDKYQGFWPQTQYAIGEAITQFGTSLLAGGLGGAKGLGEPTIVPVAAAVANALYDAVGIRFTEMPFTPEQVWRAIVEAKKERK